MPTYVYRCRDCDTRLEAFQKITEDPLTTCESCGGSINRVLQPVGVVFKGTGFYVTDYKRKENGSNGTSADSKDSSSETKETKPATEKTDKAEKKEAAPAAA
jgi:putative FmdB family regulatory protein